MTTEVTTLVNRGLPVDLNVNNSVRWVPPEAFDTDPISARFKGDSFTVGTSDHDYMLNSLSIFVAPGYRSSDGVDNNPADLADWFESTFLRIDQNQDGNLTADETVATGNFDSSSDTIDNPNISYTNTGRQYVSASGAQADIWEVNYSNLGLMFAANETVSFGVKGVGREIGDSDFFFPWFLVASNADESGYTSEQNASTDDEYLEFFADGTLEKTVDSGEPGGGWDKSSDILVEVEGSFKEKPDGGPNFVVGNPGDSSPLFGMSQSDDFIIGRAGPSELRGLSGNDTLKGDLEEPGGNDTLFGDAGDDLLLGGNGNDLLFGNDGDDVLLGEGGDDFLLGGTGTDIYIGGEGTDIFGLEVGEGEAIITDFQAGVDLIGLGGGLGFGDIYRVQADANTVIGTFSGDVLAVVVNADASQFTESAFLSV